MLWWSKNIVSYCQRNHRLQFQHVCRLQVGLKYTKSGTLRNSFSSTAPQTVLAAMQMGFFVFINTFVCLLVVLLREGKSLCCTVGQSKSCREWQPSDGRFWNVEAVTLPSRLWPPSLPWWWVPHGLPVPASQAGRQLRPAPAVFLCDLWGNPLHLTHRLLPSQHLFWVQLHELQQ